MKELRVAVRAKDFATAVLGKVGSSVLRFERRAVAAAKRVASGFKRIFNALTSIRTLLLGFIGAKAIQAFTGLITSTTEFGDRLAKLNDRLGLTPEFLSEMAFAAERSGVQFNVLELGFQRAIRRIAEFQATGKGTAKDVLPQLGLGIERLNELGGDFEKILPIIADRLRAVGNEQQRVALAFKLFDSEGVKILQLLNQGSRGIAELRRQARELGATFSTEGAQRSAEFADALTNFQTVLGSVKRAVVIEFLPTITEGLRRLTDFIKKNKEPITLFFVDAGIAAIEFGRKVGKAIFVVVDSLTKTGGLLEALRGLREIIAGREGQTAAEAFEAGLDRIGRAFDTIGDGASSAARQFDDAMFDIFEQLNRLRARFSGDSPQFDLDFSDLKTEAAAATDTVRLFGVEFRKLALIRDTLVGPLRDDVIRVSDALQNARSNVKSFFERAKEGGQSFLDRVLKPIVSGLNRFKKIIETPPQRFGALDGLRSFVEDAQFRIRNLGFAVKDALEEGRQAIAGGLTNAILEFQQGTLKASQFWKRFITQLGQDIQRILLSKALLAVVDASVAGIGSLAGSPAPAARRGGAFLGGQPLAFGGSFQGGGVVRRRSFIEAGEGGRPEAVVPLPDNRNIPVKIEGGAARQQTVIVSPQVTFQVSAIDQAGVAAFFRENEDRIVEPITRRVRESLAFANGMRGG